jgi:hypothetical protein
MLRQHEVHKEKKFRAFTRVHIFNFKKTVTHSLNKSRSLATPTYLRMSMNVIVLGNISFLLLPFDSSCQSSNKYKIERSIYVVFFIIFYSAPTFETLFNCLWWGYNHTDLACLSNFEIKNGSSKVLQVPTTLIFLLRSCIFFAR